MHRHHKHAYRHGEYLGIRTTPLEPDTVPMPEVPTLARRMPMPTDDSDRPARCEEGDNSGRCEKPTSTSSNTTLPIVLGAVIPIVCAIVVLFFLHRRNVKKLRNEDANDKHKSLDFGMDLPASGGKSMREKNAQHNHHMKGVSLDIGPSPYMLPHSLRGSKESLNSLSRSIMAENENYRYVQQYYGQDSKSIRSQRRGNDDAASVAGSIQRGAYGDEMNQGLIGNAQRISRSSPPLYNGPTEQRTQSPVSHGQVNDTGFELHLPRSPSPVHVPGLTPIHETRPTIEINKELPAPATGPAPSSYLPEHQPDFPLRNPPSIHVESDPAPTHETPIPMPRISLPSSDGASDYGDERRSNPMVPALGVQKAESSSARAEDHDHSPIPSPPEEPPQSNLRIESRRDTRRMTMGLRPLPPEDPADNPEQRANRIRSFYKEYFDESKAGQRETYYEDYDLDYYQQGDDNYVYDPVTGEYFDAVPAPYAEPVNRRAMTPPPRAPPRFQGASRHMASGSVGGYSERFPPPGPRAFSSASGRFPGARAPRKPAPPPSPLSVLPSPHLLKDDAIMTAVDFAPGSSFKDQREGRPETPLGGLRPYSPTVRAHTPLVSVFDDLAPMPSPHQLRKSGAFDNLDFAPPPRFKNQDTASDAGSIRSTRSGVSAAHLHNIRTGAYRVSRLPPETVGTKDDLMSNLRPTWDMRQ
ncbi:hypothetical protein BJX63DRAFT_149399 [Aspergillus granulosus]|uniref:Uncharacterized protein n=1 Tax=Aspergillus granulosus TaxID=176169 RepID=A0ABR4HKZ6_9EURO